MIAEVTMAAVMTAAVMTTVGATEEAIAVAAMAKDADRSYGPTAERPLQSKCCKSTGTVRA